MTYLSPPQVAKQLQVGRDKVLNWIRSGELKAANVSDSFRPRYRIAPASLDLFLAGRTNPQPRRKQPAAKPVRDRL